MTIDEAMAEIARLTTERDEARRLVIEANNSLFGSQAYFHSKDGDPFNPFHLSAAIEELKTDFVAQYSHAATMKEQCARLAEESSFAWDIEVWAQKTKKEMTALTALAIAEAIRALPDLTK